MPKDHKTKAQKNEQLDTSKTIYENFLKAKQEFSNQKYTHANAPHKNYHNPINLAASTSTQANDVALKSLMRHMMDMIKQSNDVISQMSSKVKEMESKFVNLSTDVTNDRIKIHENITKIENTDRRLEQIDGKLRQNELSVRQILVDHMKNFGNFGPGNQKNGAYGLNRAITNGRSDSFNENKFAEEKFRSITNRLRKLEDGADDILNKSNISQQLNQPQISSLEMTSMIAAQITRIVNETRMDIDHKMREIKINLEHEIKDVRKDVDEIKNAQKILDNKIFEINNSAKEVNFSLDLLKKQSDKMKEMPRIFQQPGMRNPAPNRAEFQDFNATNFSIKNDQNLNNFENYKIRDLIKLENNLMQIKEDLECKISNQDSKLNDLVRSKISEMSRNFEDERSEIKDFFIKFYQFSCFLGDFWGLF